jgi:hypothetical protein
MMGSGKGLSGLDGPFSFIIPGFFFRLVEAFGGKHDSYSHKMRGINHFHFTFP